MPKYLIVGKVDDGAFTLFKDDYSEAKAKMMDIECGLGGCTELYERKDGEYIFLEA